MSSAVAAKAAAKVSGPPSSFSTLLRRSKFATYDPKIGQVYTSYGGSVPRGDWGLKRPLAIRRSDTRITVNKLDTIYQQTEWENASTDTMVVAKFEELGLTPKIAPSGSWGPRVGHTNSYRSIMYMHDADNVDAPAGKREAILRTLQAIPDPSAMSEKRFQRYLRRLRRLAPEFEPYFREREKERHSEPTSDRVMTAWNVKTGKGPTPLHYAARHDSRDHSRFLADKMSEIYDAENSTAIRPFPHPSAGLTYVYAGELQNAVTSGPIPGRTLHTEELGPRKTSVALKDVALAGWVGAAPYKTSEPPEVLDYGKDDAPRTNKERGTGMFKAFDVELDHPPTVVGERPERIDAQRWSMRAVDWDNKKGFIMNPYKPGSAEGIAHVERRVRDELANGVDADYKRRTRRGSSNLVGKPIKNTVVAKEQATGMLTKLHSMIPSHPSGRVEDDLLS